MSADCIDTLTKKLSEEGYTREAGGFVYPQQFPDDHPNHEGESLAVAQLYDRGLMLVHTNRVSLAKYHDQIYEFFLEATKTSK